jgi:hypothetical protein
MGDYLTSLGFAEYNGKKNTVFCLFIEGRQILGDRIAYSRHQVGHLKRSTMANVANKLGLTEDELRSSMQGNLSSRAVLLCLCIQLTHECLREHLRDPILNNTEEVRTLLESVDAIRAWIHEVGTWTDSERQVLGRKRNTLIQYRDHGIARATVEGLLASVPA